MNVILVAHPDDEALWADALTREGDWQAVALTGGPRAAQFPGISLGFPDEWRILHRNEYVEWRDAVAGLRLTPDLVVTHNRMGDYGHPHHMAVHALAHELFPDVWDFYNDVPSSVGPQHRRAKAWFVQTDPGKRDRFEATYPGVYDELRADKPALIDRLFRVEWFTC